MAAIYQIGVAALIRNRRAELGLSQGELEAMSGVRKSLLSNYEAGRVKLPDLDQRPARRARRVRAREGGAAQIAPGTPSRQTP